MKLNIFLFAAVAAVASFISWQYVEQFGWTLNHTGANAGIAASWGGFGDYIGGIMNPIVAGVGLIFFIITLKQNEKALKMSAEELRLTRKELREASAAQKELAIIERENLDTRKLMRNYESCQQEESMRKTGIDLIFEHPINIEWEMPDKRGNTFTLGDLINSHYSHIRFFDNENYQDVARLVQPVEKFILQLEPLCQLFERQNKLSHKLGISYSSKLKMDVIIFHERIMGAQIQIVSDRGVDLELKDNPLLKDLLSRHNKFIEENSEVLT